MAIIGLYGFNVHGMEDVQGMQQLSLNDNENKQIEQVVPKEEPVTKETAAADKQKQVDHHWVRSFVEWYQGPYFTLIQYLSDPYNQRINLQDNNQQKNPINMFFNPALQSIKFAGDIPQFKKLVDCIKNAEITVTPDQQEGLKVCYQALIEHHAKSVSTVQNEIKKQNDENQKYYMYIQSTVVCLLNKLEQQINAQKTFLNNKNQEEKKWYDDAILPITTALATICGEDPVNVEPDEQYINYCTRVNFYPEVPKQIDTLNDRLNRLSSLKGFFEQSLNANSNT